MRSRNTATGNGRTYHPLLIVWPDGDRWPTADHVRGFVDGREWFKFSGGANSSRRAIQTMASGHLTMQLDNFDGTNMTPASYEADWVRVYPL